MDVLHNIWQHCVSVTQAKFHVGTPEFGILIWPILCYWIVAVFYDVLDSIQHPWLQQHRVTRKDPGRPNAVTKPHVILRVLLQHFLQFSLGVIALLADPQQCDANPPKGWVQSALQFGLGMVVMDTWQYWIHRAMHVNTYLYKKIHSTHHRLMIPYAYGALYNHPLEALLLDSVGALVSMYATRMSCEVAVCFFCFSTVKTVLDHCGYRFPVNPLHDMFPNSAAYHDVHHDIRGIKKNFSQPFFTWWDVACGTFLDPAEYHMSPAELKAASKKQQ